MNLVSTSVTVLKLPLTKLIKIRPNVKKNVLTTATVLLKSTRTSLVLLLLSSDIRLTLNV